MIFLGGSLRLKDLVFVYHLRDERQLAWHGRLHSHSGSDWELHYFISGEGSFQNGRHTWSILPGSLHLTPPGTGHQILATKVGRPITYYALLFDAGADEELSGLLPRLSALMERPVAIGPSHRFFFADLRERHFSGREDLVRASRHAILAFMYGIASGEPSTFGGPENAHVEKAIAIMQATIEGGLDLDGLCRRLSLSREHFVRLFSARMRMPPMRYYARLKIEAAEAMLSSTNLQVGEIADKLCFGNQFNFARAFRRAAGMSPSEYRARCLQAADFR